MKRFLISGLVLGLFALTACQSFGGEDVSWSFDKRIAALEKRVDALEGKKVTRSVKSTCPTCGADCDCAGGECGDADCPTGTYQWRQIDDAEFALFRGDRQVGAYNTAGRRYRALQVRGGRDVWGDVSQCPVTPPVATIRTSVVSYPAQTYYGGYYGDSGAGSVCGPGGCSSSSAGAVSGGSCGAGGCSSGARGVGLFGGRFRR